MSAKRLLLLAVFTAAYLVAPLLMLFVVASLKQSNQNAGDWSDLLRIAAFVISVICIATLYLTEKMTYKRMLEKRNTFGLAPQDTMYIVGLSFSFCPVCYGFIFLLSRLGTTFGDMLILTGISYIAIFAWIVRWILKYSKADA